MSYRGRTDRNWGGLIACAIAVPLVLVWAVIVFVGSTLVCADVASRCGSAWAALFEGIAAVAVGATATAWVINRIVRAVTGAR